MANTQQTQNAKKPRKFLLSRLYTDAAVRTEPEEPQKIVVAGMAEARPVKEYPDTFFGRANSVMRGEMSTLFKAGLWFILFALPFILMLTVGAGFFRDWRIGGDYYFMQDLGVGYPFGSGDNHQLAVARLMWDVNLPIFLLLCAGGMIASIGMAGLFYTAKRSYFQNYYKRITRTFFMGVGKYWWRYLIICTAGILIAAAMGTSIFYLLQQQALGTAGAGAYCAVVFSFLFGAPLLTVPMVMAALTAAYELSFKDTFKNALVVIANSPVMVVIAGLISAVPLLLLLAGNIIAIIVCIAMALIGFQYWALQWTAMAYRGMTKCAVLKHAEEKISVQVQKAKEKNAKSQYQGAAGNNAQPAPKKKKAQQPYQNPKKKKKK